MNGFMLTAANGTLFTLLYVVVIVGFFYLFLIRPQRKEQKRMAALLAQMEVGDTVVTSSGFYGTVIQVSEEDCIVEFGNNRNCRIPMRKSVIVEVEKASDGVAEPTPVLDKSADNKSADKK